jgi:predicted nucleic acid-binding protein
MTDYLLDTNHVSGIWRNDPRITPLIHSYPAGTFAICLPSIGELWFMVHYSRRVAANRKRLTTLLHDFEIVGFDHSAAVEFGRIKAELSVAARPSPMWTCRSPPSPAPGASSC